MRLINYKFLIWGLFIFFALTACEDPVPNDYIEETYIEAYLHVDEPIQNIFVFRTLPVLDSFEFKDAYIRDAIVTIKELNENGTVAKIFNLDFDTELKKGFYYKDANEKIKPETTYSLEILLPNNEVIKSETTTPPKISFIKDLPKVVNYPKDTISLPKDESYVTQWTSNSSYPYYFISVQCLDTLNYGKYLQPPTSQKNRKLNFPWLKEKEALQERKEWAFIINDQTPLVWSVFKWYGYHEAVVYIGDGNYTRWFLQIRMKNQIDKLLSSIEGKNAFGCFGSVYALRDTFMLVQP